MKQVVQVCGYKNSGKTTLISGLLQIFNAMNIRAAVIKHDVHGFEGDVPSTDTYKFRSAGAGATAITSPWRTAIVEEQETSLDELIVRFQAYDLVVVEGFKRAMHPKMVIIKNDEEWKSLSALHGIVAVVLRCEEEGHPMGEAEFVSLEGALLPVFGADEYEDIAKFIVAGCHPKDRS